MSLTILLILSVIAIVVAILANNLGDSMFPPYIPAKIFAFILGVAGLVGMGIWLRRFLF